MTKTNYDLVREFHEKFDCYQGKLGYLPSTREAMLRTRLMLSEAAEAVEAMQLEDYVKIAKELADVLYTTYGTAIAYGIPMNEVFLAVHNSNLTKTGADSDGKVSKGENYDPPDIEELLTKTMQERGAN